VPDWVVCDTIANGSRHPVRPRGARGGRVTWFEKSFPGGPDEAAVTVRVLGEVTRNACFAVRLIAPLPPREKNWDNSRFLNRAASK
jgi:hypothetical protein